MEESSYSIDDVDPPIPPAKDGSVDENRPVDGKTKSRGGKKRYRAQKYIREALRKRVDQRIQQMIEENKPSKEFYAYRKITPVYKNQKFIGFKCSWKPTIEMPASFFENPELLAKLPMYKNKTLDEIVEDLFEKQKQIEEMEQEQDANEDEHNENQNNE